MLHWGLMSGHFSLPPEWIANENAIQVRSAS
jgi:hypothetical protein